MTTALTRTEARVTNSLVTTGVSSQPPKGLSYLEAAKKAAGIGPDAIRVSVPQVYDDSLRTYSRNSRSEGESPRTPHRVHVRGDSVDLQAFADEWMEQFEAKNSPRERFQ